MRSACSLVLRTLLGVRQAGSKNWNQCPFPSFEGGSDITKFVCGYMCCDPQLSQVFLAGLPAVFKINIRDGAAGRWLENSIRFSVEEADSSRAGRDAVLAKLSELLFVETLRHRITELSPEQTGWPACARVAASPSCPVLDNCRFGARGRAVTFRSS